MSEPWEDGTDTSFWDEQSKSYMTGAEEDSEGQTIDEPWEYETDDYGYTTHDDTQSTGYTAARIAQVKRIQEALKRASYNPGTIDGKWGPKTCAAMTSFQQAKFGTAKKNWLDMETWALLGFGSSDCKLFEDAYGTSCGGNPPPGWTGAGSGMGDLLVTSADIQKIQYALGVLTTGQFDKTTCEALYKKQSALGITGSGLSKKLFETLGFTTTEAQKLATQIGQSCWSYYKVTSSGTTVDPKPDVVVVPKPDPKPVVPSPEPAKASMGWWILGGMVAVGALTWVFKKDARRS